MKITEIELRACEQETVFGKREFGVLSIHTDEGISGHNFAARPGPSMLQQLLEVARSALVGENPLDIERIWQRIGRVRGADPCIQGIVDVALWDIAGKAAGLPVYRLLGAYRDELPVYASSWVHATVDEYVDEALAYRDRGFAGYKLHPLTQARAMFGRDVPLSADLELCSAVRDAVGPDYPLFLDSAWAYDYPEAVTAGRHIQDLGFSWFEDPLGAEDLNGYLRLKQQLHIPLMATETTAGGLTGLVPWAVHRATDYLRGDVVLKGGITGMLKIAHLAEAFQLNCELHDAYDALNNLATLHLALATRNCDWYEVLIPHAKGSFDTDHLNYGLRGAMRIDTRGLIHAPTEPGLGIEPDWEVLEATTTRTL